MIWSWWYVPIAMLGLALVLAPAIGAIWARTEDEPYRPRTPRARYWRWLRGRRSP